MTHFYTHTGPVIHITRCLEVIDNLGNQVVRLSGPDIHGVLTCTQDWSDDLSFEDCGGRLYFIEDLMGKLVLINDVGIITVPPQEDPGN
jgi:hypothetical protein